MINRTLIALSFFLAFDAFAHHSMLLYDTERLIGVSGTLTKVYFGNPHSRFSMEVVDAQGGRSEWVVIAQDPGDAERFGYYEALAALEAGQRFSFVGWPHSRNDNELLGHLMLYPDGREVELIPITGYIRPDLYKAMDQAVVAEDLLDYVVTDEDSLPLLDRIQNWIWNGDPITRAAAEVQLDRAKLIGIDQDGKIEYPGMPVYLACQTGDGYSEQIDSADLQQLAPNSQRMTLEFLQIYNRVLAKHWELVRTSCGQ